MKSTKKQNKKNIRESLIEQLKKNGKDISAYIDLVFDYMFFWEMLQKMKDDINKNGLSYKSISSSGKEYIKDNPSIKLAKEYSRQMLAILDQLGLEHKNIEIETEEEDDL